MLYFEHNGEHVYGTLISNHGYYEMYGLPLWIHTILDHPPKGNFLSYKSRPREAIDFVDTVETEPMVIFLPIIRLSEKLEILDM